MRTPRNRYKVYYESGQLKIYKNASIAARALGMRPAEVSRNTLATGEWLITVVEYRRCVARSSAARAVTPRPKKIVRIS